MKPLHPVEGGPALDPPADLTSLRYKDGIIRSIVILEVNCPQSSPPLSSSSSSSPSPSPSSPLSSLSQSPPLLPPPTFLLPTTTTTFTPCGHRILAPGSHYQDIALCRETKKPEVVDHVLPLTSSTISSRVSLGPTHMIPHEVLIWATSTDKIALPRRLTFYLGPPRSIPGLRPGPGPGGHHCKVDAPAVKVPAILHGLRSEVLLNLRPRDQLIGLRSHTGAWGDRAAALKTWPDDCESSNEEGDDDAIGFMLKTKRGREVRIGGGPGAEESQRWTSRRAPEGETIVGLIAGFTGKTNRPVSCHNPLWMEYCGFVKANPPT
ncbi:hypothetical protein C7999DRAFT_35431 [Corynascus novoguineensis]|uniref:Uncharacterized protein n=1 Tax=Corynascus novoguineensis TaxID=1126955 RepID=A0AAN7HG75_9PEZI|nr:hypothetical protein C7999DRAFT_35431 [Corynascus novoguineensis]